MSSRTWLITGANSGFGKALTTHALSVGDTVIAAVRRPDTLVGLVGEYPDRLDVVEFDVTATDRTAEVIADVLQRHPVIDVLANNAGKGLIGAAEEVSETELRALFDLQVHGPIALCKAVLPSMRQHGHGTILQFSSNAGRISFTGVSAYSATKFALEGWSEAAYNELRPFGVRVVIVEPGAFRTRFHGSSLEFPSDRILDYGPVLAGVLTQLQSYDGVQPGDPAAAARVLSEVVDHPDPPLRLVLGSDALDGIAEGLQNQLKDIAQWESVTRSTDFGAGE